MAKLSAGMLVYRLVNGKRLELLIVHPGGPFWAKKDDGAWSLPKGEYDESEEPIDAAKREFAEELGFDVPSEDLIELGQIKQPSGKVITAYAVKGDPDLAKFESNTFEMEWPKKSGKMATFPEVDRAEWFGTQKARQKLLKGQAPFVDRLLERLGVEEDDAPQESDVAAQPSLF